MKVRFDIKGTTEDEINNSTALTEGQKQLLLEYKTSKRTTLAEKYGVKIGTIKSRTHHAYAILKGADPSGDHPKRKPGAVLTTECP